MSTEKENIDTIEELVKKVDIRKAIKILDRNICQGNRGRFVYLTPLMRPESKVLRFIVLKQLDEKSYLVIIQNLP